MLTRRQLLASTAVLGVPITAALPLQEAADLTLRLGVLQSQAPFIDPHDVAGSRQRALSAYRVLIRRSLAEHGRLDWVVGGAVPLSGPGPFSAGVLDQLALTEHCAEVTALSRMASAHRLRLTVDVWWRESGGGVARRLLTFDQRGRRRISEHCAQQITDGIALHMTERFSSLSLADLSAQCRTFGVYAVRIETLHGPAVPPGACPALFNGSALMGPDGVLIAHSQMHAETCLVADLARKKS